ncbi:hypothetical protein GGP41_003974 [Bipolaris sorokiniana]|uniref:Zn(2)-C6 fungal-type domain-containing protein n=1 Tax=Cochliobolus sativus TaxID=45130 RepID=A0A8H6DX33_COCSA|nr:hypothetical protein GGP41_003974 [Bipolaris sorokiniana]
MTMKLACLRCKRKKIKCDRADPVCRQCVTAAEECQYVERRKRLRIAQHKNAMEYLSQRLEQLEKHVSTSGEPDSSPGSLPTPQREVIQRTPPLSSPEAPLTVADSQESWIYRLATDTRRSFQNQATPVNTPGPSINNAMSSLNDALEDLGRLRVRTQAHHVDFDLSPAECRACIDTFVHVAHSMVVPDVSLGSMVNLSVLRSLPDVIDSPYVNVDPGMRVLYYNALYYGLQDTEGPGAEVTMKAYMKVLESVPAWLESQTKSDLDGSTAALITWTCITMHDYPLAWKFHCKVCQHLMSQGIDQIDSAPAKTFTDEDKRDGYRYIYWHTLCSDIAFHLFFGKPKVLRWVPNKIRPPMIFRGDNMHPSAIRVTICVAWVRYTLLAEEFIGYVDTHASNGQGDDLFKKADECCTQLESLMAEWKLEQLMNAEDTRIDHRLNIYTYIIGIQRLVQAAVRGNSATAVKPSPFAVRAARKVSNIILDFHTDPTVNSKSKSITNHFITLYPFCVVFTLYEQILATYNPDDCESDMQTLESIGIAMNEASTQRRNLVPFVKTVDALNRVSRTLQEERRKEMVPTATSNAEYTTTPVLNYQPTSFDTVQNLVATELPDFDMSAFNMPGYSANAEGDFQSLGLFRALENEFVARNWQSNWWDLNGGADESMNQTTASGLPQASNLSYPPTAPENMM